MRPYKIQIGQELKPSDCNLRREYCSRMLRRIEEDGIELFDRIYFSDEAWFTLTGYVNKQNFRRWLPDPPVKIQTTSLHPQKIGVWAAISRTRIIHLFFSTTVDSGIYRSFIDELISHFTSKELDEIIFQQDGAKVHTCNASIDHLYLLFPPDHVITNPEWPPRSPDLTPADR